MVTTILNKLYPSNSYLLSTKKNNNCILVDPGLDYEQIDFQMTELNLEPAFLISTHGHFDHVAGVSYFKRKYGSKFYIHEKDARLLKSVNFVLKIMKINKSVDTPEADHLLTGPSSEMQLGDFDFNIYNYPGHTEGSCLLQWQDNLFTGDTLYAKGVGLNSFPGENKSILRTSLKEMLRRFEDNLRVYPGHGHSATVGDIKKENVELAAFIKEEAV